MCVSAQARALLWQSKDSFQEFVLFSRCYFKKQANNLKQHSKDKGMRESLWMKALGALSETPRVPRTLTAEDH